LIDVSVWPDAGPLQGFCAVFFFGTTSSSERARYVLIAFRTL